MSKLKSVSFFLFLSVLIIILELIKTRKEEWIGDFWEHAAVVKELATHPIHPVNPIIGSDTPHAFFSPYSLTVAMFSKIFHMDAIRALKWFALFNLVFFLASIYLFCITFFKSFKNSAAGVSLIFLFFFWGHEPLFWSGFYHIMVLHYVLPYPSMFALSLSLLTLCLLVRNQEKKRIYTFFLVALSIAVVIITHPTTAVFLLIMIFTVYLAYFKFSIQHTAVPVILLVSGICLSLCWPYYNPIRLIFSNNSQFNDQSRFLYDGLLKNYWPVLLAVPVPFFVKNDSTVKFLSWSLLSILIVSTIGYFANLFSIGRILAGAMLVSQMLTAYGLVYAVHYRQKWQANLYQLVTAMAFTSSICINWPTLEFQLNIVRPEDKNYFSRFYFMKNVVKDDQVVLANLDNSWYLPAIAGKVIASIHPLHGVDDAFKREEDVKTFFNIDATDSVRKEILTRYKPSYLLIDSQTVQFKAGTRQWLSQIAASVYNQNGLRLLRLEATR